MHSIHGVEIFSAGTWNGNTFNEADLDKMIEAFNKTSDGVRPFLKLGHDDEQKLLQKEGLPAAGWVGRLYRNGQKLMADFVDIPKQIYELILKKAYRKVSVELFQNVQILDQKHEFLIGAVALLGAETPGVMNLQDILARYKIAGYDSVNIYSQDCGLLIIKEFDNNHGGNMTTEEKLAKAELEAQQAKAALAQAQEDAKKFKTDLESTQQAQEDAKKELEALQQKFSAQAAELKKQEIANQVQELEKEELITPAMKFAVTQLLDDKASKFSIKEEGKEDKEATRFELIKHLFSLFKASDVNLQEQSTEGKKKSKEAASLEEKIDGEIQQYMKDNECTYGTAYSAVAKKYEAELESQVISAEGE